MPIEEEHDVELTKIRQLQPESRGINIRFVVLSIAEPTKIKSKRTGKHYLLAKATVADQTATIQLSLWNWDIDDISIGQTYILRGGYIDVRDECMFLTKSRNGSFTLDKDLELQGQVKHNMSKPFAWKTKRRREPDSVRTLHGAVGRNPKGYISRKDF